MELTSELLTATLNEWQEKNVWVLEMYNGWLPCGLYINRRFYTRELDEAMHFKWKWLARLYKFMFVDEFRQDELHWEPAEKRIGGIY